MRHALTILLAATVAGATCSTILGAEKVGRTAAKAGPPKSSDEDAAQTKAARALEAAAEENKFTFVLFWKDNNEKVREHASILKTAIAARAEKAAWTSVNVSDPAERALVEKFQVSRAPMPMVLAVAPNGAITGVFNNGVDEESLERAFVTPCMTRCMKSLQEGKLVLVCVRGDGSSEVPAGVKAFKADPHFSDRTVTVDLDPNDPEEERFLADMKIEGARTKGTVITFLAPPGVMVGKFSAKVTKEQLATKLHEAGKCCDDPNCKHHQKGAKP